MEKLLDAVYDLFNVKHDKKLIKEQTERLFSALDLNSNCSITENEFVTKLTADQGLRKIIPLLSN